MRIASAVILLLILVSSSSPSAEDEKGNCICPNYSPEWAILSNTSTSIPDFFFQPYVAVKRIVICDHGVYSFFSAKEQGHYR